MRRTHLCTPLLIIALSLGAGAMLFSAGALDDQPKEEARKPTQEEKNLTAVLKKASVNGKYQMLLRQIKVPGDKESYGDYSDYGPYSGASYAGFDDLPKGFWVWVDPYWYIWRDIKADAGPKRAWGPEQATGEPDTKEAGDFQTAWASQTPDSQDEWLMLEYSEPVLIKEIQVYESFNPGAVTRVTAFKLDGSEVDVWKGKDPSAGKDIGVSVLPIKDGFRTNRIKLYIESTKVEGWNEIDAVGLKDDKGKMHWAVAAAASSFYGEVRAPREDREQRIRDLEREVRELREKIKKLEEMLDKDKKDR
jgi:hypothetical protein